MVIASHGCSRLGLEVAHQVGADVDLGEVAPGVADVGVPHMGHRISDTGSRCCGGARSVPTWC